MRNLIFVVALLLAACTSRDAADQDGSVLTAALQHFFAQSDSVFGPRNGIVLLQTNGKPYSSNQSTADLEAAFRHDNLSAPREAFENLVARSRTDTPYPTLGNIGIPARYENRSDDPAHASMELNENVITMVTLRRPGYAKRGHTAVVAFSFTWSLMHTGWASYVLERGSDNQWRVVASHSDVAL